ncbi:MAG: diaminopimelate epimerase [Vulcanimicrobiaceae bacterium]
MNATRSLHVTKMHGAENTFVLLDERPPTRGRYDDLARDLCAPGGELGGADGLLVVRDAPGAAAEMLVINADGSDAEMCGNGVRCVARYLADRGEGDAFTIATGAGPVVATIVARAPHFVARVDIGRVGFPNDARPERLDALGETWTYYDVSLGNPHAVVFVRDVAAIDLLALGTAFEADARFPRGTNLHVVQTLDAATLRARHYERGVGLTRACGTGAVACAALAIRLHGATSPVTVRVPGGTLEIAWRPDANATLAGPAEPLFERTLAR